MYIIESNQELYERFGQLEREIRELSTIFQNPNTIVEYEELEVWEKSCTQSVENLKKLIHDCDNVIKLAPEIQ